MTNLVPGQTYVVSWVVGYNSLAGHIVEFDSMSDEGYAFVGVNIALVVDQSDIKSGAVLIRPYEYSGE